MEKKDIIRQLAEAYMDGSASEGQLKALEELIKGDDEAEKYFRECIKESQGALSPAGKKAFAEVVSKIESPAQGTLDKRKNLRTYLPWVAAAAVACIAIIGLSLRPNQSKTIDNELVATTWSVDGKTLGVLLPDSSFVRLFGGAQLTQEPGFSPTNRRVSLKGEGTFDITSDREHPFVIDAGGCTVTVYGTKFNLSAPSEGDDVNLTLLQGEVDFQGPDLRRKMSPGESLTWSKSTNELSVKHIDTDAYTHWLEGEIEYMDLSLSEVAKQLGNLYGKTFVLSNELLRSRRTISVRLVNHESLEEVLDALTTLLPITSRIEGGNIYLEKK